ncbi:MAG: hypothetical protein EXR07_18965 [Acetobacteraceae bacterium]|nr:hypothetical protein [Acetobacteraceae bacterium]
MRLLLLSAGALGVGFNVKMSAALLVLPGFIALYAFSAPAAWSRRIRHLAAAAVVLTGIGLSWPLVLELTPAGQRPYVDSTIGNSVLELAIGHNALDRFIRPDWLSIAAPPVPQANGPPGSAIGGQIAWLAPLALTGLWLARRRRDAWLWSGWALVRGIVFSTAGGIFLPYYVAVMSPPLAALAAFGVVSLRLPKYRRRTGAVRGMANLHRVG